VLPPRADLIGDRGPLRGEIVADPEKDGRAKPALTRPFGEGHLGGKRRLDPGHVRGAHAGHAQRRDERRRGARPRRTLGAAPSGSVRRDSARTTASSDSSSPSPIPDPTLPPKWSPSASL